MHALKYDNGEATELRRVSNDQRGGANAGPRVAQCAMEGESQDAECAYKEVDQVQARGEKGLVHPTQNWAFRVCCDEYEVVARVW